MEANLASLEKELSSLYNYCKEKKLTSQEMEEIWAPLYKTIRKMKLVKYLRRSLCLVMVLIGLYYFLKIDEVSWHLAAIGRIAMVKMLPFWNWERHFGEKCLLYGMQESFYRSEFDCEVCESIDVLTVEENIDPDNLSELYLDLNVPVVISDGLGNWEMSISDQILNNYELSKMYPCEISSNIFTSVKPISAILKHAQRFKKWFFHIQNCDYTSVKAFRLIFPRPYFLKPEISPIQTNWLLMSQNYKAPTYKMIQLRQRIAIVGQIEGSNYIRLTPRKNCFGLCPTIETQLQPNEALVFGPMWDFEYKPYENGSNVAVILETS